MSSFCLLVLRWAVHVMVCGVWNVDTSTLTRSSCLRFPSRADARMRDLRIASDGVLSTNVLTRCRCPCRA